jgi:antimicrobial peptide system SdpB family protein
MRYLLRNAEVFDPRGPFLATSRSLLAFAELTVLLFTPDRLLFGSVPYASAGEMCSGVGTLSLWCASGSAAPTRAVCLGIAIAVLVLVITGFRPRWLCVPHWYVAFSLATRTSVIDGGDEVAQILTLLLIPSCLGDDRTWQWTGPAHPMPPAWRGSAYAAEVVLRCQVLAIYGEAAISKLRFESWRHGSSMKKLFNDPEFGLPLPVRTLAEHVLAPWWTGALLSWSVIATELCIGASMAFGTTVRRRGLVLAIGLHTAIILAMGLFSFGLTMISVLMAVSCTGSPAGSATDGDRGRRRAAARPRGEHLESRQPAAPAILRRLVQNDV